MTLKAKVCVLLMCASLSGVAIAEETTTETVTETATETVTGTVTETATETVSETAPVAVTETASGTESPTATTPAETTAEATPTTTEEATREPASEARRAPARNSNRNDDDEYNFSWLDPDKKVYVVQNRRYRKRFRPAVYATGGMNLSNPFRSEYLLAPKVSFWFNEQFGVEGLFSKVWGSSNSTFDAIKTVTTGLPFVREMNSYYGGLFMWAPYYAKLNFFNKIFYLDWFLNGGLGMVNTTQNQSRSATGGQVIKEESFLGVFYGTGFNFFITNALSFRLDITGVAYRAKGADNLTERTKTNYDLTAGVGYLFF